MHLVKQSQGSPHEAFNVATKPALNLDRKLSGATNGYNVAVANNSLRYNLRLHEENKKANKQTNSSQFITQIASHPRNNLLNSRK